MWATLNSTLATETMSRAGFDYVCVDNQHGVIDYSDTVGHLQAIDAGGSTPVVRVPWNEPGIIGKTLDAGADAVIIPMVNSVAEAEAAVRSCRYAPEGARSYGPVRAGGRTPGYFDSANETVACIPMIETVQAVAAIDDILAVPGIDAVYVGPADLSVTMGLPPANNDDDPQFMEALETVVAACARNGVVPGMHTTSGLVAKRLAMGFRMLTVSADSVALGVGLAEARKAAEAARGGVGATTAGDADALY